MQPASNFFICVTFHWLDLHPDGRKKRTAKQLCVTNVTRLLLACFVAIFTKHQCLLVLYIKNCLKCPRKVKFGENLFQQNYCHACHTRFAVFFPLPSCCVSSLSRYHSIKISGSQQSFLRKRVRYRVVRECNHAQESLKCQLCRYFFCHICRITVCWDPEILLPWQRDVTTLYQKKRFNRFQYISVVLQK